MTRCNEITGGLYRLTLPLLVHWNMILRKEVDSDPHPYRWVGERETDGAIPLRKTMGQVEGLVQ